MRHAAGACASRICIASTLTRHANSGEVSQFSTSHTPAHCTINAGARVANNAATAGSSSRSMHPAMPGGTRRVLPLQYAATSGRARNSEYPSIELAPNSIMRGTSPSARATGGEPPHLSSTKLSPVGCTPCEECCQRLSRSRGHVRCSRVKHGDSTSPKSASAYGRALADSDDDRADRNHRGCSCDDGISEHELLGVGVFLFRIRRRVRDQLVELTRSVERA